MEIEQKLLSANKKYTDYEEFREVVIKEFPNLEGKELAQKIRQLWKFYKDKVKLEEISVQEEESKEQSEKKPKISKQIQRKKFIKKLQGSIKDEFDMGQKELLGNGSFGQAFKVPLKGNPSEYRAIKVIPKSKIDFNPVNKEQFKQEIENLRELDHPSIIRLYNVYEDSLFYYLIMELCQGGEVFEKIAESGAFTEKDTKNIFRQVVEGVHYCHTKKIWHGDLKADNILFVNKNSNDNKVKIIDFGFSLQSSTKINFAGSSYYMSPELKARKIDLKADIWSMGVFLYIMITGSPPQKVVFEDGGRKRRLKFFVNYQHEKLTEQVKSLLKSCLCPSDRRLDSTGVLNHEWLKEPQRNEQDKNQNLGETQVLRKTSISSQLLEVSNLKQFAKGSHLRKVILIHMATNLQESDILELQQVFRELDSNKDGQISFEELKQGFMNCKKSFSQTSIEQLQSIFEELDTDGSGSIDYTEFIAATIQQNQYLQENKLRVIFDLIDTNKDGVLSLQEIKNYIEQHSGQDTEDQSNVQEIYDNFNQEKEEYYKQMMENFDMNGDGQIDFEEFYDLMKPKQLPLSQSQNTQNQLINSQNNLQTQKSQTSQLEIQEQKELIEYFSDYEDIKKTVISENLENQSSSINQEP